HALEDGGFALDPGLPADADRPAGGGLSRPASRAADGVKVRVHDQAWAEDRILADDDRAGGHQAGAVDFDPVADLASGVSANGQQGGAARRIADGNIEPDDAPPPAGGPEPHG